VVHANQLVQLLLWFCKMMEAVFTCCAIKEVEEVLGSHVSQLQRKRAMRALQNMHGIVLESYTWCYEPCAVCLVLVGKAGGLGTSNVVLF
jgi:hypothetical protein